MLWLFHTSFLCLNFFFSSVLLAGDYNPFDERPEKMELIPDKHSTSSVKNLQDQIIKLKNDLAQEQKKSRKLETELISCKLRLSAWKGALVKLNQTAENEAASPGKASDHQLDESAYVLFFFSKLTCFF